MLVSGRDWRYRRLAHRSIRVGSGKLTFHAKPGISSVGFPAYLLPLLTGWPRTRISRNSAAEQGESARKFSLCHNVAIIPGASGLQDPYPTPFHIPRTGTLFTRGVRGRGSSANFALRDSHEFGCTSCVANLALKCATYSGSKDDGNPHIRATPEHRSEWCFGEPFDVGGEHGCRHGKSRYRSQGSWRGLLATLPFYIEHTLDK